MRRLAALLAVLLLLAGCSKEQEPETWVYQTNLSGVSYDLLVRFEEGAGGRGTIAVGDDLYWFGYLEPGEMEFVYPNGYRGTYRMDNGVVYTGWGYDRSEAELGYIPLHVLHSAARYASRVQHSGGRRIPVIVSLLLCGVGIWRMVWPEKMWWLAAGWRYKNAAPSDLALGLQRLCGGLLVLAGLITLFV